MASDIVSQYSVSARSAFRPDGVNTGASLIATGRLGVYEIISSESQHPDSIAFPADIGTHVIRILKKDRTPSKNHRKFIGIDEPPYCWFQQGIDPNRKCTN